MPVPVTLMPVPAFTLVSDPSAAGWVLVMVKVLFGASVTLIPVPAKIMVLSAVVKFKLSNNVNNGMYCKT